MNLKKDLYSSIKIWLFLFLLCLCSLSFASSSASIQNIEAHAIDSNNTILQIHFTQNHSSVRYFTLTDPSRFVLDIKNGRFYAQANNTFFTNTLIHAVRQGQQANQTWRLSFDLNADVQITSLSSTPQEITFKLKRKTPSVENTAIPQNSLKTTTLAATSPSSPTISDKTAVIAPAALNTQSTPSQMQFSLQQDSMLGAVGQMKSSIGFSNTQAAALELDGGPRVVRANGTYGFALNDNNRVKLTGEYLLENLDFEFYTGDTRQWVDQGAIGAAYEYLFDGDKLKNIDVDTHYSHAPSKDLSTQTITNSDGSTLTDYRRIAGGNDLNGNAEAGLQLWQSGQIALGSDYDRVRYDTQYEIQDGHDAQGFGGHIRLEQNLLQNLNLQAQAIASQLFDTYGAGINWNFKSHNNTTLSAGLNSSYTQDHTTERNFWINELSLNIVWDTPPTQKTNTSTNSEKSESLSVSPLTQWVQTPAVRMPDVLAISDERITTTSFSSISGTCPYGPDITNNNGQYSASGGWYQTYLDISTLTGPVKFMSLDSANIMTSPSGQVACFYRLTDGAPGFHMGNLILQNHTYQHAIGTGSNWMANTPSQFWPSSQPLPTSSCIGSGSSNECPFQTAPS